MLKIFQIFLKIYLHYIILLIKKIKKISKKEIYFFHFFSTFKKWICLELIYLLRIKWSFYDFLIWYFPNQKFSKYKKKSNFYSKNSFTPNNFIFYYIYLKTWISNFFHFLIYYHWHIRITIYKKNEIFQKKSLSYSCFKVFFSLIFF